MRSEILEQIEHINNKISGYSNDKAELENQLNTLNKNRYGIANSMINSTESNYNFDSLRKEKTIIQHKIEDIDFILDELNKKLNESNEQLEIYSNSSKFAFPDLVTFKGRTNRAKYFLFFIIVNMWYYFTYTYVYILDNRTGIVPVLIVGIWLFLEITLVFKSIERSHDSDKSGWFTLIPIYNFYLLFLKEGTKGNNRFGNDPLSKAGY